MRVRLWLGPAGSGKTFRCLSELRQLLEREPEGAPLVLVTPKQNTYQLERQLLAGASLAGYTRLRVLSLDRLADFVFDSLGMTYPQVLDEEGRLMVLRGLLARRRKGLKLFRASARLTGFAQQLSVTLSDVQDRQLTPEALRALSAYVRDEGLSGKLHDLALLLEDYLGWLRDHALHDTGSRLGLAAEALRQAAEQRREPKALGAALWVDGFADLSGPELELLGAVTPWFSEATFLFCMEGPTPQEFPRLSSWWLSSKYFCNFRKRFEAIPGVTWATEVFGRSGADSRFRKSAELQHLERHWELPQPFAGEPRDIRLVTCLDPEHEACFVAREILRFVRQGRRFRDVLVLTRSLGAYAEPIRRVFARYDIPFFTDRRESVKHHPVSELTRNALRLVAFEWRQEDWFAALKTGLVKATESEVDLLETEALARGWTNRENWLQPFLPANNFPGYDILEAIRARVTPPFAQFEKRLAAAKPELTGPKLADAIRNLWTELKIAERLEQWPAGEGADDLESGRMTADVHATVLKQLEGWLQNLEMAFQEEALSLRDWLPILETGLGSLTVGLIPPAVDQVMVGAVDRSRNPEAALVFVLGLNESVFPALPQSMGLLTDSDRDALGDGNVCIGLTTRQHLGRERFFGYLAATRATERITFTLATRALDGAQLNPSPMVTQLRRLFPNLNVETEPHAWESAACEHPCEVVSALLLADPREAATLMNLPAVRSRVEPLLDCREPHPEAALGPAIARRLYGPLLKSSVSRLEQFAACPFRFFVHSGLRAEERQLFELDAREQGSFQHEVLARFHEELREEGKRWRDLTPQEGRRRIEVIASALLDTYRNGLLRVSAQTEFTARLLTAALQDFIEVMISWMHSQYRFDPVAVELGFGGGSDSPGWRIDLGEDRVLELQGRIDRVDVWRNESTGEVMTLVVDYKSSEKKLDTLLVENGIQLQLLAYLAVLRRWQGKLPLDLQGPLIPAGVFYVNLQGRYDSSKNRAEALADSIAARKLAFQHTGRFDASMLAQLDCRTGIPAGDQFNFRLNKDGSPNASCREPMKRMEFVALLDKLEDNLTRIGRAIFEGQAAVLPYRKGNETACRFCSYSAVCRTDPWQQKFRVLTRAEADGEEEGL